MMKRYEIWNAKVKFEDNDEVKVRPVLIWDDVAIKALSGIGRVLFVL